jgi:hypothetical protein
MVARARTETTHRTPKEDQDSCVRKFCSELLDCDPPPPPCALRVDPLSPW